MKKIIFIALIIVSALSHADEQFCQNSSNDHSARIKGYENIFCFSSASFMKQFSLLLYDNKISYVVYENGTIGYKSKDKEKIQKIGDALVMEYMKNK